MAWTARRESSRERMMRRDIFVYRDDSPSSIVFLSRWFLLSMSLSENQSIRERSDSGIAPLIRFDINNTVFNIRDMQVPDDIIARFLSICTNIREHFDP